jgi:hypothetical protein
MEPNYKYSESTEKPLTIELSGDSVYLRRNIQSIMRTDDQNNSVVYWTYEEAYMSNEEFNLYANALAAKSAIEGADNTSNIVEILAQQTAGGDNQMAIMEAIADLYDAISELL